MSLVTAICKGDRTSTGGEVLDGCAFYQINGRQAALMGDRVYCPACNLTGRIAEGNPHFKVNGQPVAMEGCRVDCGCPPGSHVLVRSDSHVFIDGPRSATPSTGQAPQPAVTGSVARHGPAQQRPAVERQTAYAGHQPEPAPETRQTITLRIGVFFDGTGNNMGNSEQAATCQAQALGIEPEVARELFEYCKKQGFDGAGGVPDSSYGNAVSNIGLLHELYRDQAIESVGAEHNNAALAIYVEGIGTTTGAEDSIYAQITGGLGTGVLARVRQIPQLLLNKIDAFFTINPNIRIEQLQFDIFGFSRGAAAARHFANDLQNGPSSLLGRALSADAAVFTEAFAWQPGRDVKINFIGLYDTVAAIVSPLDGNFAPGNNQYGDLQLGLAPGIADKVVQLVAGDEYRENFALTATDNDIVLPGAHSDLGGGYLPQMRERVLLSKPDNSVVPFNTPSEQTRAYVRTLRLLENWGHEPQQQGPRPQISSWRISHAFDPRSRMYMAVRVVAALYSERLVHGQLSLVYLQIMRELGVRHGVPFIPLKANMQLPEELRAIAEKLKAYALGERRSPKLDKLENERLYQRYIHRSGHWNPLTDLTVSPDLVFPHRPVVGARVVHPNE